MTRPDRSSPEPWRRARPGAGITEKILLRVTLDERHMIEMLARELDCSLNSAIRVSIRRGWSRVAPSTEIDGPVLDPNWTPAPLKSAPPVPGQTALDIPTETP